MQQRLLQPIVAFQFQFLCEAVSLCLGSSGLNMVTVNSVALKQHTSDAVPNVEVSEVIILLTDIDEWFLHVHNK